MNSIEKNKVVYLIGNAHLDPVWLWQWQEGFQEVKATFRSALDRMEEYDDFIFTGSSAAYYEWIEENDPKMFEEIRNRVREGRWHIAGGWWIQPDCNIPGGESFVRQGLYGQRYFQEKFGVTATVGYNVDSFGHNGMLPQILKKSGMNAYIFMRPGRHEKALEKETFCWRSPDGSEILTARIPFEYCSRPNEVEEHIRRCKGEIREKDGILMCFYGVGNHGGGPTRKNLNRIHQLQKQEEMPTLRFSNPDEFFQAVREKGESLPVYGGDLLHHSSGCYSAHSGVKRWNRLAENRMVMAEKISVLAKRWNVGNYPAEKYAQAWKNILFNQFHDILAGTSIEPAYEDARESYGMALDTAAKGLNAAIQAISWNIEISEEEGMKPIVVFNPNAFPGKFEVEMESPLLEEDVVLLDDEDRQIPFQIVQSLAACAHRTRFVFVADLPSLGYRVYRLTHRKNKIEFPWVECEDSFAQNQWFSIRFDERTGYILSLKKKNDDMEYFSGPAAVPAVLEDDSDTWSHGVRIFDKKKGAFLAVKIGCVEKGPVKGVIRVISTYENSKLIQDFSIYRELDFIHVKTTVDWHEKRSMLKLVFPMQMKYLRASWEVPYGVIQRTPDGEEYPMQNFLDVEGANPGGTKLPNGLSFLNDGKSSGSIAGKEVSLTVLRSPVYAHHEPFELDESAEYTYLDQGAEQFNYCLYPHDGSWEMAETFRRSRQINERAIPIYETYHEGTLPSKASFVKVEPGNIWLSVLKEAEDGSGDLIVRLIETSGISGKMKLGFSDHNSAMEFDFSPYEIKTICFSADGKFRETDLLEN